MYATTAQADEAASMQQLKIIDNAYCHCRPTPDYSLDRDSDAECAHLHAVSPLTNATRCTDQEMIPWG